MKWYVIQVVSGKENKMRDTIMFEFKRNGLDKFVSRMLIPSEKAVQTRNGKKYNIDKKFFPGYIFVECENISDIESGLKHIKGVSHILKQPLSQKEVDNIIEKDEKKNIPDIFSLGQEVTIVDGPFVSFLGTINDIDNTKEKVKVVVLMFGREIPLDLTFTQIEKK